MALVMLVPAVAVIGLLQRFVVRSPYAGGVMQ